MMSPSVPLQRDRERTRRTILEAAETAFAEQGANVSLAEIAHGAGVAKSGLLHHFKSRDDLVAALVAHCVQRIWDEVMRHVDIAENRPGKFTRGYVRALTGDSAYIADIYSPTGLIARLGVTLGAQQLLELAPDDPDAWNRAFEADGLPLPRVWAIRYAAEGLSGSMHTPYLTAEQLAAARAELLALTEIGAT